LAVVPANPGRCHLEFTRYIGAVVNVLEILTGDRVVFSSCRVIEICARAMICAALVLFAVTGTAAVSLAQGAAPAAGDAAAPPPAGAPGDGVVRGQHGDWQIVCKPPPPGAKNEVCALVQSVTAEDRSNVGLTIYFQKFSTGVQVLRVFAPLGVLLPPGVGLKIDDADVGHAPFHRCQSFACYAQVTVDDALFGKLKTGKTAIFIIFQTEEAGIGIPISLAGFGDAVAALN
jgi:invasion protein IalB